MSLLGATWRQGNRAEYLAQYFLTELGVSVPVLRQEDIGVDFYCSLSRDVGSSLLTFHSPFLVQCGTESKDFAFGGITKKGRWRKEALEWIFATEVPFFACVVDHTTVSIRIYSTSPMWAMRLERPNMAEMVLVPDATFDSLRTPGEPLKNAEPGKHGDGLSHKVALRGAVVELAIQDLRNGPLIAAARNALENSIHAEFWNITLRRLGLPSSSWATDTKPNSVESQNNRIGHQGNRAAPLLMEEAYKELCIGLARVYADNPEKLKALAPAFARIPSNMISEWVIRILPPDIRAIIGTAAP